MLSVADHKQAIDRIRSRIGELEELLEPGGATDEELTAVESLLRHKHWEEYRRLASQLQRAKDGDLGECAECGESIPLARILAMPSTSLCVNCAE